MALDVELKILKPNHTHQGKPCAVGDIIAAHPRRAERLMSQGIAEKVGVRAKSKSTRDEPEAEATPADVANSEEAKD